MPESDLIWPLIVARQLGEQRQEYRHHPDANAPTITTELERSSAGRATAHSEVLTKRRNRGYAVSADRSIPETSLIALLPCRI
jgi:hypothetical protein